MAQTMKRQSSYSPDLSNNQVIGEMQTSSERPNTIQQAKPVTKQSSEPVPVPIQVRPFRTVPIEGSDKVHYVRTN
jgi:hypothetical protein